MGDEIQILVNELSWKLQGIIRCRAYYSTADIVGQYKTNILSFLGYRTAGIYHCCTSILRRIDCLQDRFLKEIGCSQKDALLNFNLAPLSSRRGIAMLGVIHRTIIKKGTAHSRKLFKKAEVAHGKTRRSPGLHHMQIEEWDTSKDYVRNSIIGLQRVYNRLPQNIVAQNSVPSFQKEAQVLLKTVCVNEIASWELIFSPRESSTACILENAASVKRTRIHL